MRQALIIPGTIRIVMLSSIRYGADRHVWDVPFDEFEKTALMAWLGELAFIVSTSCTKVSVLLFYRRLVKGTFSKRWKWATIAAIIFTIIYCLAFNLALVFNCRPTEAYWKAFSMTYTADYHCANTKPLNPVSGVLSVVSDFYSVILPMGMLRHFDIDRRKKIALNAVFSLGLLVVGAGAARTYYLTELGYDYDVTWVGFNVFIWSVLEVQLAIICACAPALRVLFRHSLKDPISRAIHTASSLSRSGIRSTNRDSRQTEPSGVVTYNSQKSDSMDLSGTVEKNMVRQSVRRALETVGEQDIESAPSYSRYDSKPIRTPEEFEAYALQNLDRYRPHARSRASTSLGSDGSMKPRLSEPFSSDMKTPMSWLDIAGKD